MPQVTFSLVCPVCRRSEAGGRSFELAWQQDRLTCRNDACRVEFPLIDHVPVVHPRAAELVSQPGGAVVPLAPEAEALLAAGDPAYDEALDHLSTYLDANWSDRAQPPVDGPAARGGEALWQRLAERAVAPVRSAIDLGTSVGRGAFELARGAASAIGIDVRLMSLRRAHRIVTGERVRYARRRIGHHYGPAVIEGPAGQAHFVCADALDPPFLPGSFDRVAALNLLDAVPRPMQLLRVLDGLCAERGEVIVTSPFAWSSGVTPAEAQTGGADPAGWLRRTFEQGAGLTSRYGVEDEADLEWWLRHSARAATLHRVYYLRVRRRD